MTAVALPQERRDAYCLDLADLPYHMSDGVLEQLDELSFHLPSLLQVFGMDQLSIKALSLRENDLHGRSTTRPKLIQSYECRAAKVDYELLQAQGSRHLPQSSTEILADESSQTPKSQNDQYEANSTAPDALPAPRTAQDQGGGLCISREVEGIMSSYHYAFRYGRHEGIRASSK